MRKDPNRYKDMLNMEHPTSLTHPRMPLANRAAQFAPFAALTGYDEEIRETARLTDEEIQISEDSKKRIDEKLRYLNDHLASRPEVTVTYFVPDDKKEGGTYQTAAGVIKKIDTYEDEIIFFDERGVGNGRRVKIQDVIDIV